jgi:hypothetical protein
MKLLKWHFLVSLSRLVYVSVLPSGKLPCFSGGLVPRSFEVTWWSHLQELNKYRESCSNHPLTKPSSPKEQRPLRKPKNSRTFNLRFTFRLITFACVFVCVRAFYCWFVLPNRRRRLFSGVLRSC